MPEKDKNENEYLTSDDLGGLPSDPNDPRYELARRREKELVDIEARQDVDQLYRDFERVWLGPQKPK